MSPAEALPGTVKKPSDPEPGDDPIDQNIQAILDFYVREEEKLSSSQRTIERFSTFVGRPLFLGIVLIIVLSWMFLNILAANFKFVEFDPAPYFWLQGLVGLSGLLTSIIVLIKQNRLARMDEMRLHLDLKVTLLTEQKAAKMIDLLEELRRDLPNVRDRDDQHAATLKQAMNPELVVAALEEKSAHDRRP